MQVRALRNGFYGGDFKSAGTVFTVAAGASASWFAPVQTQDAQPVAAVAATEGPVAGKPRRGRPPVELARRTRARRPRFAVME